MRIFNSRSLYLRLTLLLLISFGPVGCGDDCPTELPTTLDIGTIQISSLPSSTNAPWILVGPIGESSGNGNTTLTGMVVGEYTVEWQDVDGYIAPPGQTITLVKDGIISFSGTYYISLPVPDFVLIPPAFMSVPTTFTMGSPSSELGHQSHENQHQVTLTKSYYMSPYEVTEELWDAVMGSGSSTSQKPKGNMTWYEAVSFCNVMSTAHGLTPAYTGSGTDWSWDQSANGYRLPTEAEWEYACRATSTTAFSNGGITATGCDLDTNLDAMGWYCNNSGYTGHDVGSKDANQWGLYDMHGNVWEYCWDGYASYPTGSVTDPVGSGSDHVLRGGAWDYHADFCRSAFRTYDYPGYEREITGFRLVRSAN